MTLIRPASAAPKRAVREAVVRWCAEARREPLGLAAKGTPRETEQNLTGRLASDHTNRSERSLLAYIIAGHIRTPMPNGRAPTENTATTESVPTSITVTRPDGVLDAT